MRTPNWSNPYQPGGTLLLKGNLHTHTKDSPCGSLPVEEVLEAYRQRSYDFLAISDHCLVSKPTAPEGLLLLAGIEADFRFAHHMGCYQLTPETIDFHMDDNEEAFLLRNQERGAFQVLNHPNWLLNHPDWPAPEHYSYELLLRYPGFQGMEIYNSLIERLYGSPLATGKWDWLLGKGKRVLGIAGDDFHYDTDLKECGLRLWAAEKSLEAVFASLHAGNFYCWYGVDILQLGREGDRVSVNTSNASLIRFIGKFGQVLQKVSGKTAEIEFQPGEEYDYIRVECLGCGEEISWSQPFFR